MILVVALLFSILTIPANAAVHILGSDPDFDGTGQIRVNSFLGEFDSTQPGEPPIDEWWINVTIPTTTVFFSNQTGNPEWLESPVYRITNHSYMGVYVHVVDFPVRVDGGLGMLDEGLDLIDALYVEGFNDIPVILNGAVNVTPGLLFALDGHTGANDEGFFEYVGFAPDAATLTTPSRPEFDLVLRFEVADVVSFTPSDLLAFQEAHLEVLSQRGIMPFDYLLTAHAAQDHNQGNVMVNGNITPERPRSPEDSDQGHVNEEERPSIAQRPDDERAQLLPQTGLSSHVSTLVVGLFLLMFVSVMLVRIKRKHS